MINVSDSHLRKCFRWIILISSITLVLSPTIKPQSRTPVGTVRAEVFGPFGGTIKGATVTLVTADRKREFPDVSGTAVFEGLPYGRYIVIVVSEGGGSAVREIVVNSREILVRVGVPLPSGNRAWPGGDLTISGDIVPKPANVNSWWVRVEGVFLNVSRESAVNDSGHFSVSGLEMGTYLVEVFESARLQRCETVEIDTRSPTKQVKISLRDTTR